jgi:DNA-binding transcriptional regulator YiaG
MIDKDIIKLRNALGLSQAEFAQLFGVHPMTVSKWERGVLKPTSYQGVLMNDFEKASREKIVKDTLKNVLIGAGVVAGLYLLLKSSRS